MVNSCDVEEPIGSERIVGENELEKRSLNLTARGGPVALQREYPIPSGCLFLKMLPVTF